MKTLNETPTTIGIVNNTNSVSHNVIITSDTLEQKDFLNMSYQNASLSWLELYNNNTIGLKEWWNKLEKVFFPDSNGNYDNQKILKVITTMNRQHFIACLNYLNKPISPCLNFNAFYLESYLNERGISTKGVYIVAFIKIFTYVLKSINNGFLHFETLDYSEKKNGVMDKIILPNREKFYRSMLISKSFYGINPHTFGKFQTEFLNSNKVLTAKLVEKVDGIFIDALHSMLTKTLSVVPSIILTPSDIMNIDANRIEGYRTLASYGLSATAIVDKLANPHTLIVKPL